MISNMSFFKNIDVSVGSWWKISQIIKTRVNISLAVLGISIYALVFRTIPKSKVWLKSFGSKGAERNTIVQ